MLVATNVPKGEVMAREFTAGEYLDATKMLASITELILLDRYWTAEVKAASESDSSALERLLVEVERRARSIAAAATRQGGFSGWSLGDSNP